MKERGWQQIAFSSYSRGKRNHIITSGDSFVMRMVLRDIDEYEASCTADHNVAKIEDEQRRELLPWENHVLMIDEK